MNNLYKFSKKTIQRAFAFVLFSIVLWQYGNAQCTIGVDTVCVSKLDTLFINADAQFTSLNWFTNNGATLNVLPGDTAVVVDWSTSSILNAIDSVCIVGTDAASCVDTLCLVTYLKDCTPVCAPPTLTLKRVGAPTICEILAANPADPIGALDCDGGGMDNLTECQNGLNPENQIDDNPPSSCLASDFYYLGFDNHGLKSEQTSGNPIDGAFPIGMVAFEDCMLPQPTPATLTATGQTFCLGGITDANAITSTNWTVGTLAGCSPIIAMTQKRQDNATLCEVVIDKGLPTEQIFTTSQTIVGTNTGAITASQIKDALEAANVLPACMVATGGSVAGISDNEAACVDFAGANWQYTIDCSCTLPAGNTPMSVTVKVCQDSGDYANYLLKVL